MNLQIEHTGLARNTITNEIIYTDFTAKYEEDSVLFLTDEEFNKYASCAVRAHAEKLNLTLQKWQVRAFTSGVPHGFNESDETHTLQFLMFRIEGNTLKITGNNYNQVFTVEKSAAELECFERDFAHLTNPEFEAFAYDLVFFLHRANSKNSLLHVLSWLISSFDDSRYYANRYSNAICRLYDYTNFDETIAKQDLDDLVKATHSYFVNQKASNKREQITDAAIMNVIIDGLMTEEQFEIAYNTFEAKLEDAKSYYS